MPKQKTSQPDLIREERAEYKTTPEEQARKDAYRARLRTFLEDPASRQIEGFPIGEIDDILALSDPPYYTACPNPFLAEMIEQWQEEKTVDGGPQTVENGQPSTVNRPKYHREPFATDVSEDKNDPIYNAHSYHTKVPHKAIMRYILHYTEPGDIVFDGFCGTGMTGVAAQLCGDKKTVESMGYRVSDDGEIYEGDKLVSQLGARKAVLNDLSPTSTFIAYNYVSMDRLREFEREATLAIEKLEESLGWLYQDESGVVANAIWSDVFVCPNCTREIVFWEAAVVDGVLQKSFFPCPYCKKTVGKATSKDNDTVKLERAFEIRFDPVLKKPVRLPKFIPVQQKVLGEQGKKIVAISSEKYEALIELLIDKEWPRIPDDEFFPGRQTNKLIHGTGISYVCHMYTPRSLFALGWLWQQRLSTKEHTRLFQFCLTGINNYVSRKQGYFGGGGGVAGTLFTPSLHIERNVFDVLRRKVKNVASLAASKAHTSIVSTQSITDVHNLPSDSLDYIFTDPPFGESIQYAELNLFVEAWLGVKTIAEQDCVLNYVHKKDLAFYSNTMSIAFQQYARVLKPGRWITTEFHNSQNAVWNSIQQAVESSGLVVADVRVLDKQQRSFNAINRVGAVDQDLIISAYKPNDHLEERFRLEAGTSDGAWDFVRYHLTQLPRVVEKNDEIEAVAERQAFLLFDRMVAFHIQRGASVPLSAGEFYAGLEQKFVSRDGMYFLPDQVPEYDAARLRLGRVAQLTFFVSDEKTAIQWLRQQLDPALGGEPKTFADLQPQFMRTGNKASHEQMPELDVMLEQNFLEDEHGHWCAPDPGKATDLERLRHKALMREFNEYVQSTGRLKQFRTEAVRAGFAEAYKKREHKVILEVAARLPEAVLHEDPDLLMYFDTAVLRAEQGN